MTNKEAYKIWAPFGKKWVDWVRPVPFVPINNKTRQFQPMGITMPYISVLLKSNTLNETAIIVDLPGTQSIEVGIYLAQYGCRPIPIHNGTVEQKGARATTDNSSIASALVWGAKHLSSTFIKENPTPVFLTDTNRLQRQRIDCSIFDNSWDVYHQDLPTEEYFLNNGITKILVISNNGVSKDLKRIFAEYPKKKLSIYWTDGYDAPKYIKKGR